MTKIAGAGSVRQRCGSVPKCHGSATLLSANAKATTVLGSISASFKIVESEGRQKKQLLIKNKNPVRKKRKE